MEEKSKIYDALCRESSKSSFLEKCPTVIPTLCRPETRRRHGRNSVSSTDLRTLALLSAYTPIYGPSSYHESPSTPPFLENENENSRHLRDFPIPLLRYRVRRCNRISR